MRKMHFSGEILIVLSLFPAYFKDEDNSNFDTEDIFDEIKKFITKLTQEFQDIKSVYISHNSNKADTLIGDMELVYGNPTISENLLGLSFDVWPKSFFQTNSRGAEVLYSLVKDFFTSYHKGEKIWTVLDLYAGTGTIGMIFADVAQDVISVELVEEASKNGAKNAQKNWIQNIEFVNAKVEEFLSIYLEQNKKADLLIIDPPRAGMHPSALPNILKFGTQQMIYVSCNPATLARDLEYILANSDYRIEKVQAVDMFPHTHHIETVVSLVK